MSVPIPSASEPQSDSRSVVRHPEWTPEIIGKFWDYWSSREDRDSWYFSHYYGEALVNFARWSGLLKGEVLDYGFARGLFLPRLLEAGVGVTGVEFSQRAVARANERFRDHPNWRRAVEAESLPTPLPSDRFDLIYCIEVVEHLPDAWLGTTLAELHRVAKPGGHVILTTPHTEDLEAAEVFCPFCDSLFHPVQHLRSVTPDFLSRSLAENGFEVPFCRGITLNPFQKYDGLPRFLEWSPIGIARVLGLRVLRGMDRIAPRRPASGWAFDRASRTTGPHLCTIARKPT